MHIMQIVAALSLVVLLPMFASSALADDVCRQGEQTRTVSIVYSEPGQPVPCEVLYEKQPVGEKRSLWRANNEAGYCESQAQDFVKKLTTMGWSCTTEEGEPTTD